MIGCNVDAINTEASPSLQGMFSNATQLTYGESTPFTISIAYIGAESATFGTDSLSEIVTPLPDGFIQTTAQTHVVYFDGSATMPTLQAGYTYRFLQGNKEYLEQTTNTGLHIDDVIRFTADGGATEYTTGITRVGTPNDTGFGIFTAYTEFVVPTDVPPLQWYTDHSTSSDLNGVNISGSTYVTPVTGITLEGPVANQTGNNLFDVGDHGWLSIDESLGAGERLVMNSTFLADIVDAMPDNSAIIIGLKDSDWTLSLIHI